MASLFRKKSAWAVERGIPLTATMDLTYRCNLGCAHCFNCPSDENELSFKEVLSAIDQLAAAGSILLDFLGGEILMRADFFDIAYHARRRGFALSLHTNGTMIDRIIAKRISKLYPLIVRVGLYGASEDNYAKISGKPWAFQKAIQGIRHLHEEHVPLKVSTTAFRHNSIEDLRWTKNLCAKMDIPFRIFTAIEVRKNGDEEGLKFALTRAQFEKTFREFPEMWPSRLRQKELGSRVCSGLGHHAYIDPYGNVGHCSRVTAAHSMREKPIADILRSDPLLKQMRDLKFSDLKECHDCPALSYCSPCPGINYSCSGKFNKPHESVCTQFFWQKSLCSK